MARDIGRRGLNWGCGPNWAGVGSATWIHSDREDYRQHHVGDILEGLPWDDDSFDGVVANHSLQQLPAAELDHAVRELRRVLRPGGRLRVLVPDIVGAFIAWQREDESWPGFLAISEPWGLDRKFCHYLTWGGSNRVCFTGEELQRLLLRNGFGTAVVDADDPGFAWTRELDTRLGESIVIDMTA